MNKRLANYGERYPIYVVIFERAPCHPTLYQWGLPNTILDVIECDVSDIDSVYRERITPLQVAGRSVSAQYFTREPANVFRDWHRPEPVSAAHQAQRAEVAAALKNPYTVEAVRRLLRHGAVSIADVMAHFDVSDTEAEQLLRAATGPVGGDA